MDHFFNQSDRMSEMFFQFVSDAVEPLNQRFVEVTNATAKKFKK